MRTKYKQWAVDYLAEHPEIVIQKINLDEDFYKGKKVYIEIGSGKGDFLISEASKHPDIIYIGIERVKTVAGIFAKKAQELGLINLKVAPLDVEVTFSSLPTNSIDELYLNFSDPWPKARHEKRRLTYKTKLDEYYRILKKGGLLKFKTDNDSLYEYSTKESMPNSKFKILLDEENYVFDAANDSMSEYEKKFRELGHHIHRVILEK